MTDIKQIEGKIEEAAILQDQHQFRMEPFKEITHADSFKAGAHFILPQLNEAQARIEKLEKALEVMRNAVEFYGNLSSWYVNGKPDLCNHINDADLETILYHYDNAELLQHFGGKRARQALAELEKMK